MKTYLSIIMAFAFMTLAAQNNKEMDKKFVEVTGIAEKYVVPNEIYISITLQEEKEGKNRSVEQQENVLLNTLKKLGINVNYLKLSDIGSHTRWDKKTKESYKQKRYELKVDDAALASKVLYELNQLDIYSMYVSKTDNSNMDRIKKQVKIAAVKDAKEKAQYLLEAVNESIAGVIFIKEQDGYGNHPPVVGAMEYSRQYDNRNEGYNPNPGMEFKDIKVQYKILARFEIQ